MKLFAVFPAYFFPQFNINKIFVLVLLSNDRDAYLLK
ncbi:hypothetical protein Sta7437_2342 [Stanieria cyanosphaera PCC 7437]|uniref:Uncharacterized protein n=1 Tax=Stanieria cyanosphaera (strain ATCC 29371 / PCC 7437) TaxID=111780 RepID=K9XTL7_STAC7|nr:hypothetical protein Sta7437_2342 [Stanieria cyanosphaera PCC 7437]